MTPAATSNCEPLGSGHPPLFVDHRVLRALRLQIAILDIRACRRNYRDLEVFLIDVEQLLRDLVREAGAA